jgi:hypothetical protein
MVKVSRSDRETAVRKAVPFRLHASVTCPAPAAVAASIAWELSDLDVERAERAYDALRPHVEHGPDAEGQLRALGETELRGVHGGGIESLLLDKALERGTGHPILVAVILQELGRRAGLPVGIVGGAAGHFVAHQRLTEPLLLDPMTGRLVEAQGVLQWRCGHQVAAELLDELQPRYERIGDFTRAVRVAKMRCTLPFDDTQDAEQQLKRITARLN